MDYTYVGRTGLKVSRICLGTMNFGPQTNEKDAFTIMDAALDAGINFFDTANVYGGKGQRGLTELIIGRWFAQGGARRDKVVLATKVYGLMDNPLDGPNDASGLSGYKLRRSIDLSLRRLKTDHVELYQMHHIDTHAPWDELWGAYEDLIAAGKVVYAGSSNFGARHLCYAQAAAEQRHFLGLISEQHKYSLNCRLPELEVLPAAQDLGLGIIAWSPLDGGLLSDHPGSERSQHALKEATPQQRTQVARLAELAAELGEKSSVIALAWVLAQPAMTAPIIGPRTMEQLEDALKAVTVTLSEDALKALDAIFPGPGGHSPDAYAW